MLAEPSPNFADLSVNLVATDPSSLFRVTRFPDTEPYFGKSGGCRFDDPLRGYGVCYAGDSMLVAFAESILHDLEPENGSFHVAASKLEDRYVISFDGSVLDLADLTGTQLKRLGGNNDLSSELPYFTPQKWSKAVHEHPSMADGLRYVSRHMNTGFAYALFERSRPKVQRGSVVPLIEHPHLAVALQEFNVHLY